MSTIVNGPLKFGSFVYGQVVTLVLTVAGLDLTQCLPAVDRLLAAEELGSLGDQVHFQFLLKAGYEHLEHIFDKWND